MALLVKYISPILFLLHFMPYSLALELCVKDRCFYLDEGEGPLSKNELLQVHHCFGLLNLKSIEMEEGLFKIQDLAKCSFEYQASNEVIELFPKREEFQFCSYGSGEPSCIMNSKSMAPKPLPPLPNDIPFNGQTAGEISTGILMCGGPPGEVEDLTLCHLFNRTSWEWQTFPSLLLGGDKFLMISNAEKIAFIGGRISTTSGTKATQIFNGTAWSLGPDMNTIGWDSKSAALNESHYLIVGGYEHSTHFNDDVLIFDLDSETVQTVASYPDKTVIAGAMKYSYNGKDFALCFGDQSSPISTAMYQLDLDNFTWSRFDGETPTTFVHGFSMMTGPQKMWVALIHAKKWDDSPYYYKLTVKHGTAQWEISPALPNGIIIGTKETERIE